MSATRKEHYTIFVVMFVSVVVLSCMVNANIDPLTWNSTYTFDNLASGSTIIDEGNYPYNASNSSGSRLLVPGVQGNGVNIIGGTTAGNGITTQRIAFLTNTVFGLAFWVKCSAPPATNSIMWTSNQYTGTGHIAAYGQLKTTGRYEFGAGKYGVDGGLCSTEMNICDGQWHHIVSNYNGSSNNATYRYRIYVDGVLGGNSSSCLNLNSATGTTTGSMQFFSGNFEATGSGYGNYSMDELRVMRTRLFNSSEIHQLASSPAGTFTTSDFDFIYKSNEASGNLSNNGNTSSVLAIVEPSYVTVGIPGLINNGFVRTTAGGNGVSFNLSSLKKNASTPLFLAFWWKKTGTVTSNENIMYGAGGFDVWIDATTCKAKGAMFGGSYTSSSSGGYCDGNWHFFVEQTRGDGTMQLYVDNYLIGSVNTGSTYTGQVFNPTGAQGGNETYDIVMYGNKWLDASTRSVLYNGGLGTELTLINFSSKVIYYNLTSETPTVNLTNKFPNTTKISDFTPTIVIDLNDSASSVRFDIDSEVDFSQMRFNATGSGTTWTGTVISDLSVGNHTLYFGTNTSSGWYTTTNSSGGLPSWAKVKLEVPEYLSIQWMNSTPSDIGTNTFGNHTSYYNVSTNGNLQNVTFYHQTNNTAFQNTSASYYVNGTSIGGWLADPLSSWNTSNIYGFSVGDNQYLPAVYPLEFSLYATSVHTQRTLSNVNQAVKILLLNITNMSMYNSFEIMITNVSNPAPLSFHVCNDQYVSGPWATSPNCADFGSLVSGQIINHTHSLYSHHSVIPFPINTTSGTVANTNVKITSKMQFIAHPSSNVGSWSAWYISQISTPTQSQHTSNNGNTWNDETGSYDAHLHSFSNMTTYCEYVYANTTSGLSNISATHCDILVLAGLPPSPPTIINPEEGFYRDNITITLVYGVSPNGYPIVGANVTLRNYTNNEEVLNITSIPSSVTSFQWNTTAVADGEYVVCARNWDNASQVNGYGCGHNFTIDNTPPAVSKPLPNVTTVLCDNCNDVGVFTNVEWNVSASDANGVSKVSLNWTGNHGVSLTQTSGLWTGISQLSGYGTSSFTATATDVANNTNTSSSTNVTVYSSIGVSLISPSNAQLLSNSNVSFTWYATTISPSTYSCDVFVDDIINKTVSTTNTTNILNVSEGSHTWKVNCSNGYANNMSETRSFIVDTTKPSISSVVVPASPSAYSLSSVTLFAATVTDASTITLTNLTLDGTSYVGVFNGSTWNTNVNGLGTGTHNYTWTSKDAANNTNTSEQKTYVVTKQDGNITIQVSPSLTIGTSETWTISCASNNTDSNTSITTVQPLISTKTSYTITNTSSFAVSATPNYATVADISLPVGLSVKNMTLTYGANVIEGYVYFCDDTYCSSGVYFVDAVPTGTSFITAPALPAYPTKINITAVKQPARPTFYITQTVIKGINYTNPYNVSGTVALINGTSILAQGSDRTLTYTYPSPAVGTYQFLCYSPETGNYTEAVANATATSLPLVSISLKGSYDNRTLYNFSVEYNGTNYSTKTGSVVLPFSTNASKTFNITVHSGNGSILSSAADSFLTTNFTNLNASGSSVLIVNQTRVTLVYVYPQTTTPLYNTNFTLRDNTFNQTYLSNETLTFNPSSDYHLFNITAQDYAPRLYNITFTAQDTSTYYVEMYPNVTFLFWNEATGQPLDMTKISNGTVLVTCPNNVYQYSLTPSTTNLLVQVPCLFSVVQINLQYPQGTYYRPYLVTSTNITSAYKFWLIDLTTTTSVLTTFQILDYLDQYINPRIMITRLINATEEQMLGNYVDIEGKITAYLIQNQQYVVKIIHDDGERIMGNYLADQAGSKIIRVNDVNLNSNVPTFSNEVSSYVYMTNESGTVLVRSGWNSTSTSSLSATNFTITKGSPSGDVVFSTRSTSGNADIAYTVNSSLLNESLFAKLVFESPNSDASMPQSYSYQRAFAPGSATAYGIREKLKFSHPDTLNWLVFLAIISVAFIFSVGTGYIGSLIVTMLFSTATLTGWLTLPAQANSTIIIIVMLLFGVTQFILSRIKASRTVD